MKGAGMTKVPDPVLRERFGLVTEAARDNLGAAIDLVLVHNEKEVRGRQPRASLNRAVVVMAISAWDRFIADTSSAFTTDPDYPHWGSGLDDSTTRGLYADPAAALLTEAGATEAPFLQRLRVRAATSWSGVRMQAMENLTADAPGRLSGLTFAQHLNQWVTVRNALAHGSIRRLLRRVEQPARWQDPKIGDPYASVLHGRFHLWESDATGGSGQPDELRLVGATIQSGCARGCLSLIIQAIDWLIVDIGHAHGRGWDVEDLRLPQAWFDRELPRKFRGDHDSGHAHWSLWGGTALHRRES